jgi:hypothetical protein
LVSRGEHFFQKVYQPRPIVEVVAFAAVDVQEPAMPLWGGVTVETYALRFAYFVRPHTKKEEVGPTLLCVTAIHTAAPALHLKLWLLWASLIIAGDEL